MAILRRRAVRTRLQKALEIMWPSMGWERLVRYYKHRIGRLPGTPYFIAAGFATGIAVSFTPFIGFHLMMAGVIAWLLRGSMVAMVLGTVAAGNPWTFPFIWLMTYELGQKLLGGRGAHTASTALNHHLTFTDLLHKPMELLLPMTLGSVPFVLVSWVFSFYFVRQIVKGYKEARHRRIHKD